MLSIITRTLAVIAILTLVSSLIPDAFTSKVDGALQYFSSSLQPLNTFINVSTLYDCLAIVFGFLFSVMFFVMLIWFLRITGGQG